MLNDNHPFEVAEKHRTAAENDNDATGCFVGDAIVDTVVDTPCTTDGARVGVGAKDTGTVEIAIEKPLEKTLNGPVETLTDALAMEMDSDDNDFDTNPDAVVVENDFDADPVIDKDENPETA